MRVVFMASILYVSVIISTARAEVVVYPAPNGADMAAGITVTANGRKVPVYAFPTIVPSGAG